MAIDFPAAPTIGQVFVVGATTYTWDGTKWKSNATNSPFSLGSAATPSITFIGDSNTGIYSPGADQVSITTGGTERFRFDATGQLESVSLGTAAAPAFSFTTDSDTGLYSPGANQVAISTGGSGRLFVDASGNVGVGTSTPNAAVEAANGNFLSRNFGTASNFICETAGGTFGSPTAISTQTTLANYTGRGYDGTAYRNVARVAVWNDGAITSTSSPGFLWFGTTPSGSTSLVERLRITSAGLVGVGTSGPARRLESVETSSTGTGALRLRNDQASPLLDAGVWGSAASTYGAISAGSAFLQATNANLAFQTEGGAFPIIFAPNASERLRITSAGLVGIGTSTPARRLEVSGSHIRVGDGYGIEFGNDQNLIVGSSTNNNFQIYTNNALRATIDSSGRVGIGTTTPFSSLHVSKDSANPTVNLTRTSNSATTLGESVYLRMSDNWAGANSRMEIGMGYQNSSGTVVYPSAVIGYVLTNGSGVTNGDIYFATRTATTDTAPIERARIDSSGRLLVGTSSAPTGSSTQYAKLVVRGNTATSNESYLVLGRNSAASADQPLGSIWFADNADGQFARIEALCDATPGASDFPGRLTFSTTADGASSPTERLRISNNGRVGITDVSQSTEFGLLTLTRAQNQPDNRFHLAFHRESNWVAGMGFLANSQTFAIQNPTSGNNTGAGVTLATNATSWGTTSDERKKRIGLTIQDGLEKIADWRCIYFSYLNEPEDVQRVGLIAQDVQQTVPEAISVEDDETGTLQLRYTELIPVLVKALQESKERIETLEAKVASLESA